jgi:urease accessory protein
VGRSSVLETVGRRGALSYEFERAGRRTILTRSSCTSPWHHFPPSYLDDSGCAYTWLVNPSGGLVGGDHVSVEARFHARTHVLMTSPSANRVYRSLSEQAVQEVRLSVGPDARLEWLPEVTIPFSGSRFRQTIHVDLAPGATVVLWDAIASGRIAMQERWAFARIDNEIRIQTAAGGSAIERFQVTPETVGKIAAEWDYVASLFVIGDAIESGTLSRLKDAMADLLERWPGEVLGGVSEPAAPGLAIKLVARSAPALTEVLESLSAVVRAQLWGLSPAMLRRY